MKNVLLPNDAAEQILESRNIAESATSDEADLHILQMCHIMTMSKVWSKYLLAIRMTRQSKYWNPKILPNLQLQMKQIYIYCKCVIL